MTSNAGAMADRPLAIEARGLIKRFDGFTAVDGVDISVPEGSIYGIEEFLEIKYLAWEGAGEAL